MRLRLRVRPNAFGNALGYSLAESSSSGGNFNGEGSARSPYVDGNGDHIIFGPAGQQADVAPFLDAFGQDYGSQWGPGVEMADASGRIRLPAGWSMNNGRMVAPDGTDMGPMSGSGMVNINIRDGQRPAAAAGIPISRQLTNVEAMAAAYHASGMTGATGDVADDYTPAYLPGVGYADETNTFPPVTIRAPAELSEQVLPSTGTGSIRPIGEVDGFFTFNPLGRGIRGLGGAALDAWLALPRAAVGVGNLVRDAWGYTANAVTPQRSVLTGQPFDYQPRSGLIQSLQQNGVAGTAGMAITGAVRNAPGIGLIGALGAPSRDWGNVGAQVFSTGTAASVVGGGRAQPYRTMDEVLLEVNRNADMATELTRRAYARGVITGSPQAFGTRAHSIFEGLNERLNRRLIGESAPFRIAVEEFRDPAGIVTGRRATGSIGADVRVFDAQTGTSLRVLDLKTHGGVQIPIGQSRQQDFINRFGLPAEEMYRLR